MVTKVMYGKRWKKLGPADESYTTKGKANSEASKLRKSGYKTRVVPETARRGPFKGMTIYKVYYR